MNANCGCFISRGAPFVLFGLASSLFALVFPLTITAFAQAPPAIITHPQSQSKVVGQNAVFTVEASGTDPNYQWLRNGIAIPGATAPVYTVTNVTLADNGNRFRVTVQNPSGSVTSDEAILTVGTNQPPTISGLRDRTIAANRPTSLAFTVADADSPVSQVTVTGFSSNPSLIPDQNITVSGTNSNRVVTLVPATNRTGTATIMLVAVDASNGTSQAPFSVTVITPPAAPLVFLQPGNQTVDLINAEPLRLEAEAISALPIFYQWRRNGANIPGATNSTYLATNGTICDAGLYELVAYNENGIAKSAPAIIAPIVQNNGVLTDNFAERMPIQNSASGGILTNNLFATFEPSEPCHAGKPASKSLWMTWVAPANGTVTFETCGSTFDTLLAVYDGAQLAVGREIVASDMINPSAIIAGLQNSSNRLSLYLYSLLSPLGKNLVDTGTVDREALAQEFEMIVAGTNIFAADLFADVELRCETAALATNSSAFTRLVNRLLLEDVFSDGLAKEGLTPIGSSEDSDKPTLTNGAKELLYTSRVTLNVQMMKSYTIAVDGFYGSTGNVVLSWKMLGDYSPQIVRQPGNVAVDVRNKVSFVVEAENPTADPLTFEWYRDGKPVSLLADERQRVAAGGKLFTGVFETVARSNTIGTYQVKISDNTQAIWSDTVTLQTTSVGKIRMYDKRDDAFHGAHLVLGNSRTSSARPGRLRAQVAAGILGTSFGNLSAPEDARLEVAEASGCGAEPGASTQWIFVDVKQAGTLIVEALGGARPPILNIHQTKADGKTVLSNKCEVTNAPGSNRSIVTWQVTESDLAYFYAVQVDSLSARGELLPEIARNGMTLNAALVPSPDEAVIGLSLDAATDALSLRFATTNDALWGFRTYTDLKASGVLTALPEQGVMRSVPVLEGEPMFLFRAERPTSMPISPLEANPKN